MDKLSKSKLKLLYINILKGYSECLYNNSKVYIKHFDTYDVGSFDLKYEENLEYAKSKGLPTLKEKEEEILANNLWDAKKDADIFDFKEYIERLKITKSKLFRISDIDKLNSNIKEYEEKISKLEIEKEELVSYTAESFARKKVNDYSLFCAFFQDNKLQSPLFTEENFYDLEDFYLNNLTLLYNEALSPFKEENLKRIALSPFFFNFYSLAENALEFYGKPIVELTFYQTELLGHGRFFKNLFANSKTKAPENLLDEPAKLIEWFESSNNLQDAVSNQDKTKDIKSLVGISKEDRERLGLQDENPHGGLMAAAMKSGGTLDMAGIMKIVGKG